MKKPLPLTDAEINEIDELLGTVPAPFETVDAVILDGYLAGVIVQPVLLQPEDWLPPIFGTEGMPEPERRERTERSDRGDRQPRGERPPRQYAERNEQSDAAPTAAQDDQPQA